MALLKALTTESNITVNDSYIKVEDVRLIRKNFINFKIKGYTSSDNNVSFYEESLGCSYDLNGDNPIKQAYEYLKTLPEFSGATDC